MGTLNAPANSSIVLAHSISSRVELDYSRGTASKTYTPPTWVKVLYASAFQAPFPYSSNLDAIEAARHRRRIAGHLTRFWFGWDVVSPVLEVRNTPGEPIGFVTKLVRGEAPKDRRHARAFLREVTAKFLDAGLPTWQVTPYNPRAIGNLMEKDRGMYRIIDLESNLVAPLMPVSGIIGAIRQGTFPTFDDIDVNKLDAYIAHNAAGITAAIGEQRYAELVESAGAYRASADAWHKSEKRIISRTLKFALKFVDVPSWIRGLKRITASSTTLADRFVQRGIETWAEEGHINQAEATRLRVAAKTPEVASALTHLGAHIAITIPLRFPVGSIARAAWTVGMRTQAEWRALFNKKYSAASARREHTALVAGVSLIPGLGAAAYMLSKPLRSNRELAVIAFDHMLRKTPFRLYERLHVSALTVWQAKQGGSQVKRTSLREAFSARASMLRPHANVIGAVIAVNLAIVAAGGILYFGYDTRVLFDEKNLMNTSDALQLLTAGIAGIAAYRLFWTVRTSSTPLDEAAGIFFWGIAGVGMLYLAADDYFGLHETMGEALASRTSMIPMFTNTADDIITVFVGVTGLTVLYMFRDEVFARRASSALLVGGVAAAALMTLTDVYGHGVIRPLEFPAQVAASGLLMLAFTRRYFEVRALRQPAAMPAAPVRQKAQAAAPALKAAA